MILVTGATGNLGSHLTLKLLENNEHVVCLYRNEKSIENLKQIFSLNSPEADNLFRKIIWRKADITNLAEVEDCFEDIDYVYHCAAMVSLNNKKYQPAYDVNVTGTENLVNMALKYKVKKFLHVSSIAAIGENKNGMISETNYFNPSLNNSVYSKTKYYGEMRVWRGIEEGLNAVIVNPSIILGPYKLSNSIKRVIKYFKNKGIKYYTNGIKGYIDVFDLVDIMIKLMESDISSERFIISSENLTFKQIIDYINLYGNHEPSKIEVKKFTLEIFRFLAAISFFGRKMFTRQTVYYLLNDKAYSNDKIKKAIDHKFKPINESIANIFKIYEKEYDI